MTLKPPSDDPGTTPSFTGDTPLVNDVHPSPNHGDRKGRQPDAIILHHTAMVSGEAALLRLCDPAAEVSAHYLVWEDGRISQLVAEKHRAWHAGQSYWAGERDMNSVSIGIELVHPGPEGGSPPYEEAQIAATIALCLDIMRRRSIPAARVLGHCDIAPDRKDDPSAHFPWAQLAAAGVGLYVPPSPIVEGPRHQNGEHGQHIETLQSLLAILGYGLSITNLYGMKTEAVVRAFQRHYRPALIDGIADVSTIETLKALLAARSAADKPQKVSSHPPEKAEKAEKPAKPQTAVSAETLAPKGRWLN
ncbi:peptidoglycan recognition protein family protein [Beijerinckia indica]|uniref:N-acetylmuramoyl-L-alanine amidase n=1 Tax=Beijerinckia indica subsp. indica (strain ATCC 9039 / DSM 1715 / NCIMB 8712) TaxID=395963 RepID=B2IHS0_BEII9|nr:N-acetylmuramyl-L-alanine amidase, negative regulator of AmpC, AmpD [Beijerinckia indica subsp. indica ATCC 9039]